MPLIFFIIITAVSGFVGLVQESTSTSVFYPLRIETKGFIEKLQGTGHTEQVSVSTEELLLGSSTIETQEHSPVVPDTYTQKISPTFRVSGGDDEDDDD